MIKFFSDTYRVIFECCPLWEVDIHKRNTPLIWTEMTDNRKGQFFISFRRHNDLFQDAVKCSETQFGFLLSENIDVNDLYHFIEVILAQKSKTHNPIDIYRIYELQLALALYFQDTDRHNKIKHDIEKEISFWDANNFFDLFSESIEEWKSNLYQRMENREQLILDVEQNLKDNKVAKLKSGHIFNSKTQIGSAENWNCQLKWITKLRTWR